MLIFHSENTKKTINIEQYIPNSLYLKTIQKLLQFPIHNCDHKNSNYSKKVILKSKFFHSNNYSVLGFESA